MISTGTVGCYTPGDAPFNVAGAVARLASATCRAHL